MGQGGGEQPDAHQQWADVNPGAHNCLSASRGVTQRGDSYRHAPSNKKVSTIPDPALDDGRTHRVSLLQVAERSITAERSALELKKAFILAGGPPKVLRMDNGPEMASQVLQRFCVWQ
jgi:hypothetical protein